VLGVAHPVRRTPYVSLAVWTGVTICFILLGHFYEKATALAILISTLAAVIWYVLAMVCLFVLRRKEPGLPRPYRVPIYPWIPAFVALLSAIAACLYGWVNVQVLVPTALLYIGASIWYAVWAQKKVLTVAPEEVAARIADELARRRQTAPPAMEKAPETDRNSTIVVGLGTGPILMPSDPVYSHLAQMVLEKLTKPMLLLGLLSLVWMILRALRILPPLLPQRMEVFLVCLLWVMLFVVISLVGFLSTTRDAQQR
jgi:amino acid transporter